MPFKHKMAKSYDSEADYEQLRKSVIKQKDNNMLVPSDLYKLASLLARWKVGDALPVCLLCRDLSKQPSQLGHIFPHSVLRAGGQDKFFDFIRGTVAGRSRMGYRLFCSDCENIFKQGEDSFNPLFFKPLFKNPEKKIVVKATEDLKGKNFPWLYYTLISIVWRSLCVIPNCGNFIEMLECLRDYLLNREASKKTLDTKVKLFLFAPNSEINKKLSEDNPVFHRYFYNWFHAIFNGEFFNREPFPTHQREPNARMGWVVCAPLHAAIVYSAEKHKAFRNLAYSDEWESRCMLTSETVTFTIGDQNSRFFPVDHYDMIVDWGSNILSSTTRLPSADKHSSSSSLDFEAAYLYLLPNDVSYDETNDKFSINSEIYKGISKMDVRQYCNILTVVKAERGKEKILFVAVKRGLCNGGVVAVGLKFNDDGTVSYMKGLNIPKNVSKDLTTPPFKQGIEELIKELKLQI